MSYKDYNNDFFSYQGTISRKNYIINMLIITALFICINFVRFETFLPFIRPEFLYKILIFMVEFFKFVLLMSAISVIYRRIADFSNSKSNTFKENMKKLFSILFVFPFLYDFCIRYFIDFIPFLQHMLDIAVNIIIIPIGIIALIIFCFIKGN